MGFIYEQGQKVVRWALFMNREERLSCRRELYRLGRERETTEEREERLARRLLFTGETAPIKTLCTVAKLDSAIAEITMSLVDTSLLRCTKPSALNGVRTLSTCTIIYVGIKPR